MRGRKSKWIVAGSFAAAALLVNWLTESESSPLYHYFIWHVGFPNLWARINTIPYVVAIVFQSGLVYLLALAAQWALVGLLLHSLLRRKTLQ